MGKPAFRPFGLLDEEPQPGEIRARTFTLEILILQQVIASLGRLRLPQQLVANCNKTPERTTWMNRLPVLLRQLEVRWSLRLGEPFDHTGSCSWVAPATRANGEPAVLKLAMPHMEGQDEILGLRFWNGNGTVRLSEADLLNQDCDVAQERCLTGTTLHS